MGNKKKNIKPEENHAAPCTTIAEDMLAAKPLPGQKTENG